MLTIDDCLYNFDGLEFTYTDKQSIRQVFPTSEIDNVNLQQLYKTRIKQKGAYSSELFYDIKKEYLYAYTCLLLITEGKEYIKSQEDSSIDWTVYNSITKEYTHSNNTLVYPGSIFTYLIPHSWDAVVTNNKYHIELTLPKKIRKKLYFTFDEETGIARIPFKYCKKDRPMTLAYFNVFSDKIAEKRLNQNYIDMSNTLINKLAYELVNSISSEMFQIISPQYKNPENFIEYRYLTERYGAMSFLVMGYD